MILVLLTYFHWNTLGILASNVQEAYISALLLCNYVGYNLGVQFINMKYTMSSAYSNLGTEKYAWYLLPWHIFIRVCMSFWPRQSWGIQEESHTCLLCTFLGYNLGVQYEYERCNIQCLLLSCDRELWDIYSLTYFHWDTLGILASHVQEAYISALLLCNFLGYLVSNVNM